MNKTETKRLKNALIVEAKRLIAERKALTDKLITLDRRLNHLERSLAGINALLGEVPGSRIPSVQGAVLSPINPGNSITEGIRQLFQLNKILSAPLIRDALENAGFQKADNKLLIQIHNNLKRLAYAGEIQAIRIGRKLAYESVSPLERVLGGRTTKNTPKRHG